mmetsp:Transcript_7454/g.21997  ORF Transcript_7454/g.21997 Transcript_7454/m.21997 type:complete len:141 (-) Transcript_7454:751-1173(-)
MSVALTEPIDVEPIEPIEPIDPVAVDPVDPADPIDFEPFEPIELMEPIEPMYVDPIDIPLDIPLDIPPPMVMPRGGVGSGAVGASVSGTVQTQTSSGCLIELHDCAYRFVEKCSQRPPQRPAAKRLVHVIPKLAHSVVQD